MISRRSSTMLALLVGVGLLAATLYRVDIAAFSVAFRTLRTAAPWILLASGGAQAGRIAAWWLCFPAAHRPPLLTLARIRLAGEAFSFLTVWGVVGEPLKVLLLPNTPPTTTTAALALERVSYLAVTTVIMAMSGLATTAFIDLAPVWRITFQAFAIGSASAIVLALLGARRRIRRADRAERLGIDAPHPHGRRQRVARFILSVERELVDLARTGRSRVTMLIALQTACHLCMVLEVWIVLRAAGIDATVFAANGVETVTRIVSLVSAFIPANLGALEASNVAAASAVGAAAAGGALAVARRVRGLFWAAVGLALFPRGRADGSQSSDDDAVLAYVAEGSAGNVSPFVRVVSLPLAERVMRAARAAGYGQIWIWAPSDGYRMAALARRAGCAASVTVVTATGAWRELASAAGDRAVTVVGAGTLVSTAILRAALSVSARSGIRDVPAGATYPVSGVLRGKASDLIEVNDACAVIESTARAPQSPSVEEVVDGSAMLALRVDTPDDVRAAEAFLERATYKPTDPYLARFNRRISMPVSRVLLRAPITANQVSVALVALGFYSGWVFTYGTYRAMVGGAVLSLIASIADGCDGEIARLKYQESAFGCWLDTFGDYTYYIAVFIGMTAGVVHYTGRPVFYYVGAGLLAAVLVSFALLILLRQRITGAQPELLQRAAKSHLYASGNRWAWLAAELSFCATRSSMPYGLLAFAVAGLMPAFLVLATIGATVFAISLAVKFRPLVAGARRETVGA